MDFGNLGVTSYTTKAKVAPFVDYLAQGEFRTTRCRDCGKIFYPPQVDCPFCLHTNMDWIKISSRGKLISFTTAQYGPSGFENRVPYTLGIVEFLESIRVLSPISTIINPETLRVGMELQLRPIILGENRVGFELILD